MIEESSSPPNPMWDLWALSEAMIKLCLASLMGESCPSLTRLGAQQYIAIFERKLLSVTQPSPNPHPPSMLIGLPAILALDDLFGGLLTQELV